MGYAPGVPVAPGGPGDRALPPLPPHTFPSKMVIATGLTPAWQQILRFERLAPGEVNRAAEARWCASGKVLNVGRALNCLGVESRTLSVIGGLAGEAIAREFAEDGLDALWVRTLAATRCCTTLLDGSPAEVTELVENAAPLLPDELREFQALFAAEAREAEVVVLSGSLPQGTPATLYRDLLGTTSAESVLDVRGPELLAALEHRPRLVKPNRFELGQTFGKALDTDESLHAAMRELLRLGAGSVLVTQGSGPAWFAWGNDLLRFDPQPVERVVNPIGCGDCVAAGVAAGISHGLPLPDSVALGLAAARENLKSLLPARFDRDAVERTGPSASPASRASR